MVPPNPKAYSESIRRLRKQFAEKKCLAPFSDHSGDIIAAHTLSLGSMLKPIARNGHVYSWDADFYPASIDEAFDLKLRGIKDTSVFNGFCGKHDNELFKVIDNAEFICSPEQLFLHAYRAVAKESYAKRKQFESFPKVEEWAAILNIEDSSQHVPSPETLLHLTGVLRGVEDIERLKTVFDEILVARDFRRLVTHILPFRNKPGIVCNAILAPDSDFNGNELQNFLKFDADLNPLTITVLPANTGGFVLLSYLDNRSSGPAQLVESLLRQADLTSSLIWLIISYSDNTAIMPDWWENLSNEHRLHIQNGFRRTLNVFDRPIHLLTKIPLAINDWQFEQPFRI